jgi:DNA-binding HxlR family transcriptional regulator
MKWDELEAQQCAIARFLSVFGDRWALLIMTDAFLGVRRFETFQERLGISRTTLGERLTSLCESGVLQRVAYQEKPTRHEYRLTQKGLDLHPTIMAMTAWGNRYYSDEGGPPILFEHTKCSHDFQPVGACSECGETVHVHEMRARVRPDMPHLAPVLRGPIHDGD